MFSLFRFRPFGAAPSEHTCAFVHFAPEDRMKMSQAMFHSFARPAPYAVLSTAMLYFS